MDRLTNLNTVLSPSTKAATAAAGAIKNALAGLGSLRRHEGPAGVDGGGQERPAAASDRAGSGNSSGAGGGGGRDGIAGSSQEKEAWREKEKAPPSREAETAAAATATAAAEAPAVSEAEPTATPAGAEVAERGADVEGKGDTRVDAADGCEKEATDRKRDDLGRSVRDTALTMRGLAKLYPLSQSFRQAWWFFFGVFFLFFSRASQVFRHFARA